MKIDIDKEDLEIILDMAEHALLEDEGSHDYFADFLCVDEPNEEIQRILKVIGKLQKSLDKS